MLKNPMRKIFQKKYPFPFIFITFGVFFSFILVLSVPSLYNYTDIKNKLKKNVESDFGFQLKNINKINYRFVPSPHLVLNKSDLYFQNEIDSKVSSIENIQIFVSLFSLYKKDIKIKRINITNSNFELNKKTFDFILNHFDKKKINNLTISKSKIFYKNQKKEISIISPIKKLKYFTNIKSNQKTLNIVGNIYDTNYIFKWRKPVNNLTSSNFTLKFDDPKLYFQNNINQETPDKNKGNLTATFLNHKLFLEYNYDSKKIEVKTKNTPNSLFSATGFVNLKPFHFEIDMTLKKQKISKIIESLLNYYYINKNKLHPNISGNLNLNLKNIENAYFKSGNLQFNFYNSDIILMTNLINIRNLGSIRSIEHLFYEKNNNIIFATDIEIEINNVDEFYRRFSVPKKNRVFLEKIYLILEKEIYNDNFSISNFSINKKKKIKFDEIGLNALDKSSFNNYQKFRNVIISEFKKFN